MRQRNIKNLDEKLKQNSAFLIEDPQQNKGRWSEVFANGNPIFLEIGCGKGQFITSRACLLYTSWVNLPAIILLSPKVIKIFRDYDRQRKMGLDPVFEPSKLGIDNAELWDEIVAEKYSDLLELKREAERKTNL